ncbi:MAG: class I SAM-dependent methyltransferase [Planctomycetota bacterium]
MRKRDTRVALPGERCFVCGERSDFLQETDAVLLRESWCAHCGASKRDSDVARVLVTACLGLTSRCLLQSLDKLALLHIYLAQASGSLHKTLRLLPHFICSEYLDGVPPGRTANSVRCEDLARLTFDDGVFDLVITQDVLEHVQDPEAAFLEICRVLKPGGWHVFTVPLNEAHRTQARARLGRNGRTEHLLPRVHHGDPLRKHACLVFTDFGRDLVDRLEAQGMPTEDWLLGAWHSPEEVTWIGDERSYAEYRRYRNRRAAFFRYNSHVFLSRKPGPAGTAAFAPKDGIPARRMSLRHGWVETDLAPRGQQDAGDIERTGERILPWKDNADMNYEHLHRYAFASEFVGGLKVLDLACGEGYGSSILATRAAEVTAVELDPAVVQHAAAKYRRDNLRFIAGSITDIPLKGEQLFDVVVCFEAIEHIEDHDRLLNEVKRLLKDDGVFVVSTPNKLAYSDEPGTKNPFHVRELYVEEFTQLLAKHFPHTALYGQRVYPGSHIFPLNAVPSATLDYALKKDGPAFTFTTPDEGIPLYIVAVASNRAHAGLPQCSHLVDISGTLVKEKDARIQYLVNENARLDSERLRYQMSFDHVMNKPPVRAYRAVKGFLRSLVSRSRAKEEKL